MGADLGAKQCGRLFCNQAARRSMARLDVPGEQVFPGPGFALNQGQPDAGPDLLELFTHAAHGQRSRHQLG
jgi:hypothetical protein